MTQHDAEPPRLIHSFPTVALGAGALVLSLLYAAAAAAVWVLLDLPQDHAHRLAIAFSAFGVVGPSVAMAGGILGLDQPNGRLSLGALALTALSMVALLLAIAAGVVAWHQPTLARLLGSI